MIAKCIDLKFAGVIALQYNAIALQGLVVLQSL